MIQGQRVSCFTKMGAWYRKNTPTRKTGGGGAGRARVLQNTFNCALVARAL